MKRRYFRVRPKDGAHGTSGLMVEGRGFTLVELLVVIAIIGILVALLLPAIQAAREAARRSQCSSQIKQLALGALNHHDTFKHLPTGGWGWYWVGDPDRGFGADQPGGWIYNLLPFIEESALHDSGADGQPDKYTHDQAKGAAYVVQAPITIINCPSRRASKTYPLLTNDSGNEHLANSLTPDVAGRSDYAICSGNAHNELGAGPDSLSQALDPNYMWPGLKDDIKKYLNGVSYQRSMVGIQRITDGTSNTYLLGERYIPVAEYEKGEWRGDNETWCTGMNNDNFRVTGRLDGGQVVELLPAKDTESVDFGEMRFGSPHSGGWLIAFCDGSVRSIAFAIDWQVHRDLGNREDDNVIDSSGL